MNRLTVGDLRASIAQLPDDAEVSPDFGPGDIPRDDEPGVELMAAHSSERNSKPYLSLVVRLFYLDDIEDNQGEGAVDDDPGAARAGQ